MFINVLFSTSSRTVGEETYQVHRLTSLSVIIPLQWILSERISLNMAHLANYNHTQLSLLAHDLSVRLVHEFRTIWYRRITQTNCMHILERCCIIQGQPE